MYVYAPRVCLWRSEEGLDPQELELWMIMSCNENVQNQTLVLCKSRICMFLTTESSLQLQGTYLMGMELQFYKIGSRDALDYGCTTMGMS